MNILVTGGGGQLGTELKKYMTTKNTWLFLEHDELDILDEDSVEKFVCNNNIDVCINCAAFTKFDDCPNFENEAFMVNSIGPEILAKVLKRHNSILVHISSDYVFDGKKRFGFYNETDTPIPISVYGKTKVCGENKVIATGVDYLIFRVSWLYGGDKKNFVSTIYDKIEKESTLKIVADQIGTPTYVTDFAKFLIYILDNFTLDELKAKSGLYHYANNGKTTWWNIGEQTRKYREKYDKNFINKCKILKIKTNEYPSNDNRPKYSPLSNKKVKKVFGVKITPWKKALKMCIIKYVKQ